MDEPSPCSRILFLRTMQKWLFKRMLVSGGASRNCCGIRRCVYYQEIWTPTHTLALGQQTPDTSQIKKQKGIRVLSLFGSICKCWKPHFLDLLAKNSSACQQWKNHAQLCEYREKKNECRYFMSKVCEPQILDWINVVDPSEKPFGIFAQINNGKT